jgi:hypothetical protein
MKPAIANECATIQALDANALAPTSPVSDENGRIAG